MKSCERVRCLFMSVGAGVPEKREEKLRWIRGPYSPTSETNGTSGFCVLASDMGQGHQYHAGRSKIPPLEKKTL